MEILVVVNGWLASRLLFTFNDQPLAARAFFALLGCQAVLVLLLSPDLASLVLLAIIVSVLFLSERWLPQQWLNEARLLGLMVVIAAATAVHYWTTPTFWFTPFIQLSDQSLHHLQAFLWLLLGFLLVANEANLLIRTLLHRLRLEPTQPSESSGISLDQREYNAGRLIGILERWLIYLVLVEAQNYNVIALVIAAKGFARFRQMDQRVFAEYVLIGTLASTLLTVIVSQIMTGYLL